MGAEAAAKQNKELEERYDKGIYPVAIFLITNPAFYEFDNRFHGFPAEVWMSTLKGNLLHHFQLHMLHNCLAVNTDYVLLGLD